MAAREFKNYSNHRSSGSGPKRQRSFWGHWGRGRSAPSRAFGRPLTRLGGIPGWRLSFLAATRFPLPSSAYAGALRGSRLRTLWAGTLRFERERAGCPLFCVATGRPESRPYKESEGGKLVADFGAGVRSDDAQSGGGARLATRAAERAPRRGSCRGADRRADARGPLPGATQRRAWPAHRAR